MGEGTEQTLPQTTGVLSQLSGSIFSMGRFSVQVTGKSRFEG